MKCMFKSTITLPNGSVAQVECATAEELASVITSNIGVVTSITTVAETKTHHTINNKEVKKPYLLQGKVSNETTWSEKDIMSIADSLKETGARHGTIQDTVRHVRLNGDVKRSEWSVYVMVNRVKRYMFDGKVNGTGLSKYVKKILHANNITPGSQAVVKNHPAGKKKQVRWSNHDISEIGKIIQQNLHLKKGLSNLVGAYIKKNGDVKVRTVPTVYSTTSSIKQYLTGENSTRLVGKMKKALSAAGIYPSSQGTPVTITRINTPEEA